MAVSYALIKRPNYSNHRTSCLARALRFALSFSSALFLATCGCREVVAEQLRLAWDPSPAADLSGYVLNYSILGSSQSVRIESGLSPGALITGLKPTMSYEFTVSALNQAGSESDPSLPLIWTAPTEPQILSFENGVGLWWKRGALQGDFVVKRASKLEGPYIPVSTNRVAHFFDSRVASSHRYYYSILIRGCPGRTHDSTPLLGEARDGPGGLIASRENNVTRLEWARFPAATGYLVKRGWTVGMSRKAVVVAGGFGEREITGIFQGDVDANLSAVFGKAGGVVAGQRGADSGRCLRWPAQEGGMYVSRRPDQSDSRLRRGHRS